MEIHSNVQAAEGDLHFRWLLVGNTGAGKSWTATSFPDVFIINTDKRLARIAQIRKFDYYTIDAYDKAYVEAMEVLKEFKLKKDWTLKYKTLVIDSLTALSDLMEMELIKFPREGKGESGEVLSLPDYNVHHRRMINFVRYLQDLEINSICTANVVLEKDDMRGTVVENIMLTGKKEPKQIPQYFDEVYYHEYDDKTKKYQAWTKPHGFFKNCKTGFKMPESIIDPVYTNLSKYYEIKEEVKA
jgi:hypothetical protein